MRPARRTPLTVHVTPELAAALRSRAECDDRTVSSTAARILSAALAPSTSEAALADGSAISRGTAHDVLDA